MPSPTTSSPGPSAPDAPSGELVLGTYAPGESAEALELERASTQGKRYRLAFRREAFHLRAEGFARHRIVTARLGGRLVGIGAAALKDVTHRGEATTAAFLFDLRVHPAARGAGVGRRLTEELLGWAEGRSALAYTYVMADNAAAARVGLRFGTEVGGYVYLVYPVYRSLPFEGRLVRSSMADLHAEAVRRAGPWDLAADPLAGGRTAGWVASWRLESKGGLAGCSAWTTRGVLEEVVVSLPPALRAARALFASEPFRRIPHPALPAPGEALRSWYLFDLFASSPRGARALLRAVAAEALSAGVDWLYLAHAPGDPLARAARRDVPRVLSPLVPYRLLVRHADGSTPLPVRRLLVDPRDL